MYLISSRRVISVTMMSGLILCLSAGSIPAPRRHRVWEQPCRYSLGELNVDPHVFNGFSPANISNCIAISPMVSLADCLESEPHRQVMAMYVHGLEGWFHASAENVATRIWAANTGVPQPPPPPPPSLVPLMGVYSDSIACWFLSVSQTIASSCGHKSKDD